MEESHALSDLFLIDEINHKNLPELLIFAHLDGIHRGSEDGVVVLDAPPVSGSGGAS